MLITRETEEKLKELGVRDSKTLSDVTITNMAIGIRKTVGHGRYEEVAIGPLKYNLLYQKLKNLNRILGWAHARVIENLLSNGTDCDKAIADQFGDRSYIESALMKKGRKIQLLQVPRAERDASVAAASILARDVFLRKLRDLKESYILEFPKGATHVVEFGKELIKTHGVGVLQNVAKLHFSTTKEITGGIISLVKQGVESSTNVESLPKEQTDRRIEEARLELFNLISNIEEELRRFIKRKLEETFGVGWWEQGIDGDIRKKCEGRVAVEMKKGRKVDPIECLDFEHYWHILTSRHNWEPVFAKVFKDKSRLQARLTILKDLRDPVAHSRGQFGSKTLLRPLPP